MSFIAVVFGAVPMEACCSSFLLPQLGGRKYFVKGAEKSWISEELNKKNKVIDCVAQFKRVEYFNCILETQNGRFFTI